MSLSAVALGEESLALFTAIAAPWGVSMSHGLLAQASERQGDAQRAEALYEKILATFREHGGDEYMAAQSLHGLGMIAFGRGITADAAGQCWSRPDVTYASIDWSELERRAKTAERNAWRTVIDDRTWRMEQCQS